MSEVLTKYLKLKTVNDEVATDTMLKRLVETPDASLWIRDEFVGDVCVYHDSRYPKYVIECVIGSEESSVTTLFERNSTHSVRQALFDARKELIYEIGEATRSLPSMVAIQDKGRGRDVFLREMSTAQLVDVLSDALVGKLAA